MGKGLTLALALGLGSLGATAAAGATVEAQEGASVAGEAASDLSVAPVLAAANTAAATLAVSSSDDSKESEWEVSVTPYLWASGVKADISGPGGQSVEMDTSFTDILDVLKFALMGITDIRYKRFVSVTDIIYMKVGDKAQGLGGSQFIDGKIDMQMFMSTATLGYRAVDRGPMYLDLLGGVRIVSVDVDIKLSDPQQSVESDASKTTVAPIVAARFHTPIAEKWGLEFYADIGGITKPKLTWQLAGTVDWTISDRWSLFGGYRYMKLDYGKNGFDLDLGMGGPIFGATYRF